MIPRRFKSLVVWLILLAAVPLVLSGCPSAPPPVETPPECDAETPCGDGLICRAGRCLSCQRDRDCDRDQLCHPITRRCELKVCYGRDCQKHDDCALGLFCVQGLCLSSTAPSTQGCAVQVCGDTEPCGAGLLCHPVNKVCEEQQGCTGAEDCAAGQRCDTASKRCVVACTESVAAAVCGQRRFCLEGGCVDCREDADCGPGLRCDPEGHHCLGLTGCESDRDCAPPLVCHPVTRQCTVDPGACLSNEECDDGQACELATGRCRPARCQPDRFEPDDDFETTHPLPVGRTEELTVCEGESDYFTVTLSGGDTVQVLVDTDPLLPFTVEVWDPLQQLLAQGSQRVVATAAMAGDHRVRAYSSDQYVQYALRTSVSRGRPCAADATEPNNQLAQATTLVAGDLVEAGICPGDVDMYVAAVQPGDRVAVDLSTVAAEGPLLLELWDATGASILASAQAPNDTMRLEATVAYGTRLYIRVLGQTPQVRNRYDLRLQVEAP